MKAQFCLIACLASVCAGQQQLDKITPDEGDIGDQFGNSVDLDGAYCVAGAYSSNLAISNGGAAFVFQTSDGMTWTQIAELTASEPDIGAQFGRAVAISGNTVIVGAQQDDAGMSVGGAAYVYEQNVGGPNAWGEVAQLIPGDIEEVDQFGAAVAIDGDWAVVGAPGQDEFGGNAGAAYVFRRVDGVWIESQKLLPSEASSFAEFGWSVAIDGDTMAIGTRRDDSAASNGGSAFVFELQGDMWAETRKLFSDDIDSSDWFGEAVAVEGDVVVVGARNEDELGSNAGAAYVFERDEGGADNWGQTAKLLAGTGEGGDLFGEGVAVAGDTIIVGAPNADSDTGEAYYFTREDGSWSYVASFKGDDTNGSDRFGRSVALDGPIAMGGAGQDGTGSAYLFKFACDADFNCDGEANILDFVAFQQAFLAFSNAADCDENGLLNILDFVCFQQVFAGGC